jgi:IMP dehydrogenase
MLRIDKEALTFDDVLLVPGHSQVLPHMANLQTRLTRGITLNMPLISAAMDTVTEAPLAIALAQEGGIGFVHKNMTPEAQAEHVLRVKKYESGVVVDPVTVSADDTIGATIALSKQLGYSGFPVVDEQNNLIGIVTSRDLRFENRLEEPVFKVMTSKEKLVTVTAGASPDHVMDLMHEHRIEKILVVDQAFKLTGLITVKDFQKAKSKPNACKDERGRLRVGAAVSVGPGTEERIKALVDAGVDVLLIDTSHGHSQGVIDRVKQVREQYPDIQLIAGNVATAEAGVDAVKVGIGPGSICTTRIVTGCGVPQITAISDAVSAVNELGIPVIADGGIRFSGDVAKALAAGASSVMVGSMLAGTEEAPGEVELYQGRYYKSYRGMGSLGAMNQNHGSSDRYFQTSQNAEKLVPEGIEGRVAYKGPIANIIHQQLGGLRSAMGLTGCATIDDLRTKPKFVKVTSAGMGESHVHDVSITKEAPNYRLG